MKKSGKLSIREMVVVELLKKGVPVDQLEKEASRLLRQRRVKNNAGN